MGIAKANQLVQENRFSEAEDIYKEMYDKTKLDIYKFGLEYTRAKQNKNSSLFEIDSSDSLNVKSERKKILFITAGLKGPTAGGGIATCFHSMVKNISLHSNEEIDVLYIAHPYYSKENYDFWKKKYKEEYNANLITIDVLNNDYGSKEMKRSYGILQYIVDNENNYGNVVFHDFMGLAYYSLLAKRTNLALSDINIIISAHGNHTLSNFFGEKKITHWDQKVIIFMEKESLKYADMVTTPSSYYRDWIADEFEVDKNKIVVMPNIIFHDNERPNSIDIKFKDSNKSLIVFYGRMERLKGLDLFINAINKNDREGKSYNILFAGNSSKIDGKDAKSYILSRTDKCSSEIQFLFNCKAKDLFAYIKDNDGRCVFPTLGETSSCVVVECILHGVPFLASSIPGIKELVADEYHKDFLFTTGSLSELAEKIEKDLIIPSDKVLSFDMNENGKLWYDLLNKRQYKLIGKNNEVSEEPLVSVVIPTNNRPDQLLESLQSIHNQSYSNLEIIVIDDNSETNDLNESICSRFNAQYVYLPKKSYKGAACNLGVSLSKGKYICFFDDDDIAHAEMISRYVRAYSSNNNVDIISGFAAVFEHEKYVMENTILPEYTSLALGGGLEVNLHINFFGKGTFIIKKEKFLDVGGYEVDYDKVPMVDYRFYMKSALSNLNIMIIPTIQYYYRKNSPRSLFYDNLGVNNTQYLAKHSMQKIIEKKLGNDVGAAVSSMIWDVSLPLYK